MKHVASLYTNLTLCTTWEGREASSIQGERCDLALESHDISLSLKVSRLG